MLPGMLGGLVSLALLAAAPGAGAQDPYDFVDAGWGVDFLHAGNPGASATYSEIMGSGACVFDYDGDDWEDLLLVNGAYDNATLQSSLDPRSALYRNLAGKGLQKVAGALNVSAWGMGCATGDYDNDGDQDVAFSTWGSALLYRNDGDGVFTNVTTAAGVEQPMCGFETCFGASLAWMDHDLDADLDLFVTNYVAWDSVGPASPNSYSAQCNQLYRNNGNGTFTDVAEAAGAWDCSRNHLALAIADVDGDRDQDVFIASDESSDTYLRNNGDGTFTDLTVETGLGDPRGGMGAAWGDYDGDGLYDLAITHFDGERFALYRQGAGLVFTDRAAVDGLDLTTRFNGWGIEWADYDADGDLDLLDTNGHVNVSYCCLGLAIGYGQLDLVLRNEGNGTLTNVTADVWHPAPLKTVGRGLALGDLNQDGYLDVVFVNNPNQTAQVWKSARGANNWLQLRLSGNATINPAALGAVVEVNAGGKTLTREVVAAASYLSQSTRDLHFGLGAATRADTLVVTWPDGSRQEFAGVLANQLLTLKPGGTLQALRPSVLVSAQALIEGNRVDPVTLAGEVLRAPSPLASSRWSVAGETLAGTTVQRAFRELGEFPAVFRAEDADGRWDEAEAKVVIRNLAPTASIQAPAQADRLKAVSLDGAGSADRDGQVVNWTWTVGGQQLYGAKVEVPFTVLGTHAVSLRVRDDEGATAEAAASIEVVNLAPVATAGPDQRGNLATLFALDGSASHDPDGAIVNWTWDLGDGTRAWEPKVAKQYAAEGTYPVSLTVRDDDGATSVARLNITVFRENKLPVAVAGPDREGTRFSPIGFDGSASSDPDGSIVAWAWDFGDGASASGAVVAHSYSQVGNFTVTLTVTDDTGGSASDALLVRIVRLQVVTHLSLGQPSAGAYLTPATPLTLTPLDPQSGSPVAGVHTSYTVNGGATQAYEGPFRLAGPDGPYVLAYWSFEVAGEDEPHKLATLVLDTTPPRTELAPGEPRAGPFVSGRTPLAAQASDPLAGGLPGSGVAATERRVSTRASEAEAWRVVADWTPTTAPFQLTGPDGFYAVELRSRDILGNLEAPRSTVVVLDNTPPRTAALAGEPSLRGEALFVSSATPLQTIAADPGAPALGSGVAATEQRLSYSPDLGATWRLVHDWRATEGPFRVEGLDGTYAVEVRSRDALGNLEAPQRLEVFLDNTPPTTRLGVGSPSVEGSATFVNSLTPLELQPADPPVRGLASGVAGTERRVAYAADGVAWSLVEDWRPSQGAFQLAGPDGLYAVEYRSRDALGNLEASHLTELFLDNTPPLLWLDAGAPSRPGGEGPLVGPLSLNRLSAEDPVVAGAASGVASVGGSVLRLDGEPAREELPVGPGLVEFRLAGDDGRYRVEAVAADRLGNTARAAFPLRLDGTRPAIEILAPAPGEACVRLPGMALAVPPGPAPAPGAAPAPVGTACAGTGDRDGDGFPDAAELAAGSDPGRALATPRNANPLADPGFEAGEAWQGQGGLAWRRVQDASPWRARPAQEGGALRAQLRLLLEDAWQGPAGALLRQAEADLSEALARRAPGTWTVAETVLRIADAQVHLLAPDSPPLRPGETAQGAAAWLAEHLSRPAPDEAFAMEARGAGAGSLVQVLAASPAGARACGFEGVAFDLLPDARLRAVEVVVQGWAGALAAELRATVEATSWTPAAWNRVEVPAQAFRGAELLAARGPSLPLCVAALALELRAGEPTSPLDSAAARLDNVLLATSTAPAWPEALPAVPEPAALAQLAGTPLPGPPAPAPQAAPPALPRRAAVLQGSVQLRVAGLDPLLEGLSAGLACVELQALDPDGPRAAWSSCDGTLEAGPDGYLATWDTSGFACRVELRARAQDGLGAAREASQWVVVLPDEPGPAAACAGGEGLPAAPLAGAGFREPAGPRVQAAPSDAAQGPAAPGPPAPDRPEAAALPDPRPRGGAGKG